MRFIPAVSGVQIPPPLFFIAYGPLVKGLRHRPFTAVTRVRIPHGSFFNGQIAVRFLVSETKKHLLTVLVKRCFFMVIFQNHFDLSGFALLDFQRKKNE